MPDILAPDLEAGLPAAAAPKKKKKKLMPIAYIHEDGCTGCGVCIEFCPVDCIYYKAGPEFLEGENDFRTVNPVVIVDEEVCIGCKLCDKYCPWETIEMLTPEPEPD